MADETDEAANSAEQAYAAAAEAMPVKPAPVAAKPVEAPKAKSVPEAAKTAPEPAPAKPVPTKAKAKPTVRKPAAKAKAKAAVKARPMPKPVKAPKPTPAKPKQPPQAKELPMAKPADFTTTLSDTMTEMQTRAKAAYDKSTAMAGEASEFAKGNVEALVESGKIFSENLQGLGKVYADEAKSAFETLTADMKEFAAVKSPTELFQLQSKLMRRNFDSLVAFGSKSSEAMVKIANETAAPISSRVSLAAEKFSKAA